MQFFFILDNDRVKRIIERVHGMSEEAAATNLAEVFALYSKRHKKFDKLLIDHYNWVKPNVDENRGISETKKLLVGAYFSKEYSVQSAALFNPSIVAHPEQVVPEAGDLRVVLSFRATGEGHISSIVFREGIIKAKGGIEILPDSPYATLASNKALVFVDHPGSSPELAEANYNIEFSADDELSERIIFPSGPTESNGIEDVRFVRFQEAGKPDIYYGTYTAYDGKRILSQIVQTTDFLRFSVRVMYGKAIRDKGMALFPRKINGEYIMVSRLDGENLHIMRSPDIYNWENSELLRIPHYAWEFVQIGNCGSPIETEQGWLLITHAVGPFRRYVISAILLDINDPSKVIGWLPHPLIEPEEEEREGYVPNVVYSCGVLLHNGILYLPYAMSDSASGIATIKISDVLNALEKA